MLDLHQCNLCPRECKIDRINSRGFCSVSGSKISVGRASLHMWEEPCISGENGSGTIFFAGCNLKCIYCQNSVLSRGEAGVEISIDQLADVMISLQVKGAHNINLVTPTHYSVQIIEAVKMARNMGLCIPVVYNTSGYEKTSVVQLLNNIVSIYLTDFKYADNELAQKYSGVSDYYEVALDALKEMVKQTGKVEFDEQGVLQRGVVVRHLVLPGQADNSKSILRLLHQTFGDDVIISIMNQYTPIGDLPYKELNRTVSDDEYDEIVDYALELGITNAYIQEGATQSSSFIPDFNGEGIL